jgi:alanyl-tRNA synthetase
LNEIKLALKNPQDVIKAVVSVQEENAKLKKQVEQLIRDKAKGLKNRIGTTNPNKRNTVSIASGS